MTLTKVKSRRPSSDTRKRHGKHHRHSHDYLKAYWPYLPMLSILMFGFAANTWLSHLHRDVLGYATDMSVQSLFDDTNVQRADNHEKAFALDDKLTTAAQNKANDMATRDYWSHNTPDGKTPWTFITAAGYDYQAAGENLAYGFATATDTITGWMNSPEHRANILNASFHDVGFGIVNIPDYQNSGPETLVVAMYGSVTTVPVTVPVPVATTQSTLRTEDHHTTATAKSAAPKPTTKQPSAAVTAEPADVTPSPTTQSTPQSSDTLEPAPQRISRIQLVSSSTDMNTLAVGMFGIATLGFVLLRHGLAWRKVLIRGERFALHHPMLDVTAATILSIAIILSHTAGLIR